MRKKLLKQQFLLVLLTMLIAIPQGVWAEDYPITVAGVQVTDDNKSNVLGDNGATVTFTPADNTTTPATPATLTLNGATINAESQAIVSGLENLTIFLIGELNTITCYNGSTFNKTSELDEATITFTTDATSNGVLTIGGQLFGEGVTPIYTNVSLKDNGDYKTINSSCGLSVGDVNVTFFNKDDVLSNGKVSFTPADNTTTPATPATLTLNGATINGSISISSELAALTINLVGENTSGLITNEQGHTTVSFTGEGSIDINNGVFNNISCELASGLYLATDSPAPYNDDGTLRGADGSAVSSITISNKETYPIWVCNTGSELTGYTQLTADDPLVNGTNGTASYNGSILTLTNFACTTTDGEPAFYIGQDVDNLIVNLKGTNTINMGNGFYFLEDNANLTFTTGTGENVGSFTVTGDDITISNISISCKDGLVFNEGVDNNIVYSVSTDGVRVKVGDVSVSSTTEDVLGDDNVSFNAEFNTLTLSGVDLSQLEEGIQVYVDSLIVNISGENTIGGRIIYEGRSQSSSIQINKDGEATSASLTVPNIEGFASCTRGDGLYLTGHDAQDNVIDVHYEHFENEGGSMQSYFGTISDVTFSTTESNTIWVAGIMSTGGDITGEGITTEAEGTVTYNANDRILTIENASISTSENNPSPLIVCNGDLTVNLVGGNSADFNGNSTYIFKNNGTTGELTFTGEGTLNSNSEYAVGTYIGLCDGFSTVDFGELAYTINGDSKKISPLNISTPMMNVYEGKIDFQTDGYLFESTTYYKIVYADGSGDEEEIPLTNSMTETSVNWSTYNEKVTISELTGPCTVYAYTKYNGETGASAKAKLFGPASTKQTIVLDADPVELAIVPAIEEGDGIKISGIEANYLSYDSETGKVTGTALGSTTFPVPLSYTAGQYTTGNTIILNSENFEMQVEVVRDLGIEFVGTNSWASYYATEDLTVPEGLTAYVVSAVNETTGEVTATSVDYIPANNAVLLQRAANGDANGYTATAYTGTTGTINNLLSGSTQETAVSSIANSPVYVLFNDKFKRATSGTIPARRAYLALGAAVVPSGAPRFMNISIGDGSVTAIKTVAVDDNSNDSWYTIDGLKLNGKPQRKGLYINKGKKMYINNNK